MPSPPKLYIGLMSGTSLDAVDAALLDFTDGCKLLCTCELVLPDDLRCEIRALNSPCDNELQRSLILDKKLAHLFNDAVQLLLAKACVDKNDIIAIGSHGQTLRHAPTAPWGYSLQIGNASLLAELSGITVVADFRSRDIAAGGQGAPLVPAFHQAVFASKDESRAIVNIGGMANISFLSRTGDVSGFDTGPGNVLMDYWCQTHQDCCFDNNGQWAKSGQVIPELLNKMLSEPFFALAPPKSTGRECFDGHWLAQYLNNTSYATKDVQATLLELTARTICDAINDDADCIYLCGGGAYNGNLQERISQLSQKNVKDTSALGISAQWIEAAAFAWLAKQTMQMLSSNAPNATGAKGERILGAIHYK